MVTVHCGGCDTSFKFAHPAAQKAANLMHVTITCKNCGVTLKAPSDELHMLPIGEVMARQVRPRLTLVEG